MAVNSVLMLTVLFTSGLWVDGYNFAQLYPLQKTLESALVMKETLYVIRQVFFPVVRISALEVEQVRIIVCVQITIDHDLQTSNSTTNASCIAESLKFLGVNSNDSSKDVSSLCWNFLWTNSALLSLITIDQLIALDAFVIEIYGVVEGQRQHTRDINISLPIVCTDMPKKLDIKTSLMLLLSWSKSYARHYGVPPQWEETDKGYIQEYYRSHTYYIAESVYTENENDVHLIRWWMIISFTLLNILVLIGMLSYGKQCYMKVYQITSGSTRMVAVTWAVMTTALLINTLYLLWTLNGLVTQNCPYPRMWQCVISDAYWCAYMNSTYLYSDEVASILVKLTVVPFTIVVELIIAVRLTSHTLFPFPCTMATISHCRSLRIGKRVIQTILLWNIIVFIQIIFGVVLLPLGILMVIAPVTTFACISVAYLLLPFGLIVLIAYSILQCCNPISFKQCCSIFACAHLFTTILILSLSYCLLTLLFFVIGLGVEPWSVKGSILSLLPSFLVTPILWLAKRYFFKKDRATEVVEQSSFSVTIHNQSIKH